MAGQAGWYRAPGEEGLLLYWNGSAWTDHRQPDPALTAPESHRIRAQEPDPMAEYERQFEPSLSVVAKPSTDLDRRFEVSAPGSASPAATSLVAQPQYRPRAAIATVATPATAPRFAGASTAAPRSFAPMPSPAVANSLGPIALGPGATSVTPTQTEFEQVLSESTALAIAPKTPAHREPLATPASVVPAATVAPNRKAVVSAARAMGIAILVILIGVAAMAFFSAQNLAGPGQAKAIGIVTSFGSTSGDSCTPIARFAVMGESFTASSNTAISPCPVGLGQDVDIIYSVADPASAAHIQLGSSFAPYLWLVPVAGVLFFLAGLTAFIVRAGSILAGIAIVRDGGKRSKTPVPSA